MTEANRHYVRSPDGRAIFGFETGEAAETAARAYGEGAHVVDTLAQAYKPMLQEIRGGELVISGFGGWDTGFLLRVVPNVLYYGGLIAVIGRLSPR